jgi:RHS repeat-associated protein
MPGRKFAQANSSYRYGFNGKEQDKETTGTTTYDYGFRIYNPVLGRFLSTDPLTKNYPMLTPYQFASNSPIAGIDLDGLEFYYAADGSFIGKMGKSTEIKIVDNEMLSAIETTLSNVKDHRTIQQVFSDAASNKKGAGIVDIRVEHFDAGSVTAYNNTQENQETVLKEWAGQNRTTEREKVMSLFTLKIDNSDGKGQSEVFIKGSTGEGEKYTRGQGGASVNPSLSTSKFSNAQRSTTIHTHPFGGPLNFSNELEGFASGGDLQWAVSNGVNLYLAAPSGNVMGMFDVNMYKRLVRATLTDDYFKKMSDAEIFKPGGVGDPHYNEREAANSMQKVEIEKPK